MGMLALLRQELPAQGQQMEYLQTALGSTRRLTALLSDILDLAKVESRRLSLRAAPFQVREMVDSTCELLALTSRDKGLGLSWVVDPEVAPTLIGKVSALPNP